MLALHLSVKKQPIDTHIRLTVFQIPDDQSYPYVTIIKLIIIHDYYYYYYVDES